MKIEGDTITLSTGREVYANRGIIGLSDDLRPSYGYDGGIEAWGRTYMDEPPWSKAERQELADYMIALWTQFREADNPLEDDQQ
jgi:hypothetical protein